MLSLPVVSLPPGNLEGPGQRRKAWALLPAHQLGTGLVGELVLGGAVLLLQRAQRLGGRVDLAVLSEDPSQILVEAAVPPALLLVL